MKRFIAITIIVAVAFASCAKKSSEQVKLENVLLEHVSNPSIIEFSEYETITLEEEIIFELSGHKWSESWSESLYNKLKDDPDYKVFAKVCKDDMEYENGIIDKLKRVREDYPDLCDQVSFTIYKLGYRYNDEDGNNVTEVCLGNFNSKGELVAYRLTGKGEWTIIGNTRSIPGYDEFIPIFDGLYKYDKESTLKQ